MDDLERVDVPPEPVHLSSSNDPFQMPELTAGQLLRRRRHRRV
jgi:hypothetical protein